MTCRVAGIPIKYESIVAQRFVVDWYKGYELRGWKGRSVWFVDVYRGDRTFIKQFIGGTLEEALRAFQAALADGRLSVANESKES